MSGEPYNLDELYQLLLRWDVTRLVGNNVKQWGDSWLEEFNRVETNGRCTPINNRYFDLWIQVALLMNKTKAVEYMLASVGIEGSELSFKEKLCLYYILRESDRT